MTEPLSDAMGPAEAARVIWRVLGRRTALHAATLIKQRAKEQDYRKRCDAYVVEGRSDARGAARQVT